MPFEFADDNDNGGRPFSEHQQAVDRAGEDLTAWLIGEKDFSIQKMAAIAVLFDAHISRLQMKLRASAPPPEAQASPPDTHKTPKTSSA